MPSSLVLVSQSNFAYQPTTSFNTVAAHSLLDTTNDVLISSPNHPIYVVGERVLGPVLDNAYYYAQQFSSAMVNGAVAVDRSVSRIFQVFPVATAQDMDGFDVNDLTGVDISGTDFTDIVTDTSDPGLIDGISDLSGAEVSIEHLIIKLSVKFSFKVIIYAFNKAIDYFDTLNHASSLSQDARKHLVYTCIFLDRSELILNNISNDLKEKQDKSEYSPTSKQAYSLVFPTTYSDFEMIDHEGSFFRQKAEYHADSENGNIETLEWKFSKEEAIRMKHECSDVVTSYHDALIQHKSKGKASLHTIRERIDAKIHEIYKMQKQLIEKLHLPVTINVLGQNEQHIVRSWEVISQGSNKELLFKFEVSNGDSSIYSPPLNHGHTEL